MNRYKFVLHRGIVHIRDSIPIAYKDLPYNALYDFNNMILYKKSISSSRQYVNRLYTIEEYIMETFKYED